MTGRYFERMVALLFLSLLVMTFAPQPFHAALAEAPACEDRRNILGTSRIVEIDTRGGILLGNQQYKAVDFLKKGEVVLTFDDGPLRRNTLRVLNALEAHCTKATFFMVGRMALADPVLVKEIDRRGHTIATHTWSHKNLMRLSKKNAQREIELGISAVSTALGKPVAPFFRFPYLADPGTMIEYSKQRDQAVFSIDGDSFDYRTKSGAVMQNQILKALARRGKGVLLFHDIQTSTARGMMSLLNKLRQRGYKVVHLVPKRATRTLSSFDKISDKRLSRRLKAGRVRGLSKTAIRWPRTSRIALPLSPLVNRGPYVARKKKKDNEVLPWQEKDLDALHDETAAKRARKKSNTARRKKVRKQRRRVSPYSNSWTSFAGDAPFWSD